tara:strand:+ start:3046 stop:3624 length:579 start_codon:yes stop_codon:yes gene_type:complete
MSIEDTIKKLETGLPENTSSEVTNKVALEVFEDERKYQESVWGDESQNPISSWLIFIKEYLNEASAHITRNEPFLASMLAGNCLRKVGSLSLACIEQYDQVDNLINWAKEEKKINSERVIKQNSNTPTITLCTGLINTAIEKYSTTLSEDFDSYDTVFFSVFYSIFLLSKNLESIISRIQFDLESEEQRLPF